jgi:hypothetical protein
VIIKLDTSDLKIALLEWLELRHQLKLTSDTLVSVDLEDGCVQITGRIERETQRI